ncbi:AAA family ATPase [Chryseobacterium sp. KLBC 52]|uniref:AAA family ATPase n=1 Tax=Chryseobacterium sp. KLBC 52 TaxID=1862702 RepID=UPI000E0B1E89|nr:AAA family ATPase [Chryseobacterium sp. KLBC 52]
MITKIKLNSIATYKNLVEVNDLKKVNFFFGNNGCGKSTIARLFYEFSKSDLLIGPFSQCSFENFDRTNENILVFDQEFIQRNFYTKEDLDGIFSLDEKNEEIEEKIKNENEIISTAKIAYDTQKVSIENLEKQKDQLREAIWETCFEYNRRFKKDFNKIDLGSRRETFFQTLVDKNKSTFKVKGLTHLTEKYNKFHVEELIKINNTLSLDTFQKIIELESNINELFNEIIVGSNDVTIAPLIEKLNNSSWIEQGISFLNKEVDNQQCPFCQQPTITRDLLNQFEKYFDTTREEKLTRLKQAFSDYNSAFSVFDLELQSISSQKIISSKVLKLQNIIQKVSFSNQTEFQKKLDKPNERKQIKSISNLKELVDEINSIIHKHNLEVDNIKQNKSELKDDVWNYIADQVKNNIVDYHTKDKTYELQIDTSKKELMSLKNNIKLSMEKVREWQTQTVNTQKAIDNINDLLLKNNFRGFRIEKKESENNITKYFILREEETFETHIFKTLSEGEKNFIAFLYFYQLCLGSNDSENSTKKKIIIIDDPVSSMDSQVLFFVSTLIRRLIAKKGTGKDQQGNKLIEQLKNENIEQVFILTHNIFFYKEVALAFGSRICSSTSYFNIKKINNESVIERIENYKSIAFNDYHLLWQEIKKDASEKISMALMNNMRRVVESYANFMGLIDDVNLWDLKNDIPEDSAENLIITALISQMQDESHRVSTNDEIYFTRISEEPKDIALKSFEILFENIGGKTHYNKMMEIC